MTQELVTTDKKNRLQIKLTGVIEVDVAKNLQAVLQRELKNDPNFRSSPIEVYDTDTENIPRFPAICINVTNIRNNQLTIGARSTNQRDIHIAIIYYHSDINAKALDNQILQDAGRIISIVHKNADLNGYCRMGVRMESSATLMDRIKGSSIMRAAIIPIVAPILYRA